VNLLTILLHAGVAPQSTEVQLLDVDGTVFIMLGIFLVLLGVLWLLLWRPYLRVRDERVARVEGARDKAVQLDAEAGGRLARIEAALAEARRAGETDAAKLRHEAQAREHEIITEAQTAARQLLTEARPRLESTVAAERATLAQESSDLARAIAEKALGRRLLS
jgi:F-type H+-transporting ATPase subunit b